MDGWILLFLVFTLVAGVIIVVAILVGQKTRARVRLPGPAELFIELDKGWRKVPRATAQAAPGGGASPASSRTWLAAKVPGGPDWQFPLDGRKTIYIGRRQDNDLVLRDRTADTRQAVIYWEDSRYKINNLSQETPTRVNGRPITKQNLGNGNTIAMGRTKLIFRQRKQAS